MKQVIPFPGPNSVQKQIQILKLRKLIWNKNQYPQDTMRASFQTKQTTLTFLAQTCPKMDLGFEIQKTNVRIRISILEIPMCANFQAKRTTLTF